MYRDSNISSLLYWALTSKKRAKNLHRARMLNNMQLLHWFKETLHKYHIVYSDFAIEHTNSYIQVTGGTNIANLLVLIPVDLST